MRFTRFAVVVFATIGLILGLMPSATADHLFGHHEGPPVPPVPGVPKAVCLVDGTVEIEKGVDLVPKHDHYEFQSTAITCVGLENYNFGPVEVRADGGTDGPCQPHQTPPTPTGCEPLPLTYHGETDAIGWSHSSGYSGFEGGDFCEFLPSDANKGDISVLTGKPARGWVKFLRVGVAVTAWGYLNWDEPDKKDDCFLAELVFVPTGTFPPVTTAALVGTAVIYNLDPV